MAHVDRIKLTVVGDSGVGKSCFVNGIVNQTPHLYSSSTIGCNVEVLAYTYNGNQSHQRDVFIEFWDIGGSSGHQNSRSIFYGGTNGIILVHDLSNRKSFLNLKRWLNEVLNSSKQELTGVCVKSEKGLSEDIVSRNNIASVPILILGTKEDQAKNDHANFTRSSRQLGLLDDCNVYFCDLNCFQQSQLITSSSKWIQLNAFFEKVIESRFYPSGRNLTQESEYWRGRKKVF